MSAAQGPSAAEQIRQGNGAIWQQMRLDLAVLDRAIIDVAELLIMRFTYEGSEWPPLGCYELSFRDHTTHRSYWHFGSQEPLTHAEVMAILDVNRLAPHERLFLESAPKSTDASQREEGQQQ